MGLLDYNIEPEPKRKDLLPEAPSSVINPNQQLIDEGKTIAMERAGGSEALLHGLSDDDYIEMGRESLKEKEHGIAGELAAGFGRGALRVAATPAYLADIAGKAVGWKGLERVGEVGAKKVEQYIQESPRLRKSASISGDIRDNPQLWTDPRWYASIIGEGAPTIASMIIPGMGAARAARIAGMGAKGIRAARTGGALVAGMGLEAGGAAEDIRQYEKRTGEKVPISKKLQTVTGTGVIAGSLEAVPVFNLFGKAVAKKLIGRIIASMALEGGTEGAQEIVANAFAKAGYDADRDMVGGVIESVVGGVLLGGGMGVMQQTFQERIQKTDPNEVANLLERAEKEIREVVVTPEEVNQVKADIKSGLMAEAIKTGDLTSEDMAPVIERVATQDSKLAEQIKGMFVIKETDLTENEKRFKEDPLDAENNAEYLDKYIKKATQPTVEPVLPAVVPPTKPRHEMTLDEFVEETRRFEIEDGMSPEEAKETITRETEMDSHKRRMLYAIEQGKKLPQETLREYSDDPRFAKVLAEIEPKKAKPIPKKAYTGDIKFTGMQHIKGEPSVPLFVTPEGGQVEYDSAKHKVTNLAEYEKAIKPKEVEKVVRPEIEIPTLTNTTQAIEFGKKATPEQITELKKLRKESEAKYDALVKEGNFDEASREALKAQLYREAFEVKEKPVEPLIPKPPKPTPPEVAEAEIKAEPIPEVAPKIALPTELKSLAGKAQEMSEKEFLDAFERGLNSQNLSKRETAQKTQAYMKLNMKMTPGEFYAEYGKKVEPKKEPKVEVPPEKVPTKPGFAWIKGKQKPILSAREITKGKNKGKYEVVLTRGRDEEGDIIPGAKKIVTEKDILAMPEEKIVPAEKPARPVIPEIKPKVKEKIEITPTEEGKEITVGLTKKEEAAVTPKQQKAYLLVEIDSAIGEAPEVKPFVSLVKEFKKKAKHASPQKYAELLEEQERIGAERVAKYGTVTIHVPDDGVFTILNTKQSLEEFKKKAKKFPGVVPKAKKVIVPGVVRKVPVVETIDELLKTPDGKEFFTDGSLAIKGKPPAGAKYGVKETTQEHIKELLATETEPAELKYYAFQDPDFGKGVAKTPMPSGLATLDYNLIAIFQSKTGELYNYNQLKLNAISKRFPKATYGIAEKEWQEGLLIAYENKKPVAVLMPIKIEGGLMEDLAIEKGFIEPKLPKKEEKVFATAITKPQDTITRQDLKDIFGEMKNLRTGVNPAGNFYFKVEGRPAVEILEVDSIGGYINTNKGRIPVGSFLKNTIELKTTGIGPTADIATAFHEYMHFLERNGIVTPNDIKALDTAIGKAEVTEEDRATYVGDNLAGWKTQTNTRIKRILKKISDFANAVYEFFSRTRTAKGVLKDIETGKILAEKKEVVPIVTPTEVKQFAIKPTVNYKELLERYKAKPKKPGEIPDEDIIKTYKEKHIAFEPKKLQLNKQTFKDFAAKVYTKFVFAEYPAIRLALKGKDPKATQRVQDQINKVWGKGGIVEVFVTGKGPHRYTAEGTPEYIEGAQSLKEIVKDLNLQEYEDYETLRIAERDVALAKFRPDIKGTDLETSTQLIEAIERKYGEGIKKLRDISRAQIKYDDTLLQLLVEEGWLSKKVYETIKAKPEAEFYASFMREMDSVGEQVHGGKDPLKKIKGSELRKIPTIESSIANTYKTIKLLETLKLNKAVVALKDLTPDLAEIIKEVKPRYLVRDVPEGKKKVFMPSPIPPKNTLIVPIDGAKHYWQVPPDVHKAIDYYSPQEMSMVIKILSGPARLLRAGATLTAEFIMRNPARDQLTAMVYSKYGYIPFIDFGKGFFELMKKGDLYQEFKAGGGEQSYFTSMDRTTLNMTAKDIVGFRKGLRTYNPIEYLRIASEAMEKATRLGVFKKARAKGATVPQATAAARESTLDFRRIGEERRINQIIAFWNANIQGTDIMRRKIQKHPGRTLLRLGLGITLPSIALWLFNNSDDDRKERYNSLPGWRKNFFWNIIIDTDTPIISLPKPFELGLIFGSLPERILDYIALNDPKELKTIAQSIKDGAMPGLIPTAALPIIENMTNWSFFMERPIESETIKRLPPGQRAHQYTSSVLKKFGKTTNISPIKMENWIRGWTGGLGKLGLDIADPLFEIEDIPEVSKKWYEITPGLKGFIAKEPIGGRGKDVTNFYDNGEEITQAEQGYRILIKTDRVEALKFKQKTHNVMVFASSFRKTSLRFGKLRKRKAVIMQSKGYSSDKKRELVDNIDKKMTRIAKRFNERFRSFLVKN